MLDALVVRALALRAGGDQKGAVESLGRALTLGVPAGYRRLFLDEGPETLELLRAAARSGGPGAAAATEVLAGSERGLPATSAQMPGLRDQRLSERELEVLVLLATDLTGPEVAGRLFVSVNTLRTHTKHIFTKLGVNTRRAAVRRGTELGLV